MNFSSPKLITDTLKAGDDAEKKRSDNRRLVTRMFQGKPYLDPEMMKKWHLDIGANFGEAPTLFAHAKRQYENSVLGSEVYFKVTLPKAPEEKKSGWGSFITNFIGELMKDSREFTCLKEYQIASIISHGPGIEIWRDQDDWLSDFVPARNFRVDTSTLTSFKNQSWVAERHDYSPGELKRKVFGPDADLGWKKDAVKKILSKYDDLNYEAGRGDWNTSPEERDEMWSQNLGYFSSDAAPSISLYHFHYYDDTDPKNCFWKLCVIPDWERLPRGVSEPVFLYKSDEMFARAFDNFLSVQTGDLNTDAPFHYHSQRSLGFSLLEPCFWNNMAICRLLQHLLESYNPWFRVDDPEDRARVNMINLAGHAVIAKGVSVVPNTERHHVEPQLIESTMSKLKQVMSEASTSYTQSTDTGTAREQTAFETRVKLSTVNAMMTGLLGRYFRHEKHPNKERCRRLCKKDTTNADARRFQEACIKEGIPRVWLDVKHWKIEPEIPMGSGNPTMAQTMIDQLLSDKIFPRATPTAQGEILHEALEVLTNDSRKAERWQPVGKEAMLSDGMKYAGAMFGSLMTGSPPPIAENFPPADLITVWIGMMSGVIQAIAQTDNMGTAGEHRGLDVVAAKIGEQIARLDQQQTEAQRVKEYGDDVGKLMNEVKAFKQRLAEKNQQSQMDPEAMAKIEATKMKTASDIENKQVKLAQGLEHKQITMAKDQERKDAAAAAEQKRQDAILNAELEREEIRTGSEIGREEVKTKADISNQKKKAAATPKTSKAKKE